jgi:hypothetical protein
MSATFRLGFAGRFDPGFARGFDPPAGLVVADPSCDAACRDSRTPTSLRESEGPS